VVVSSGLQVREVKELTDAKIRAVTTADSFTVKSLTYFLHSVLSPLDRIWHRIQVFTGLMFDESLNTFPSLESWVQKTMKNTKLPLSTNTLTRMLRHWSIKSFLMFAQACKFV